MMNEVDMKQSTYNIIMACKRCEYYDFTQGIKEYLSQHTNTPIQYYSQGEMNKIMISAMYDYIDTCDRPSSFLHTLREVHDAHTLSIGERIARAFYLVRVCEKDGNFVNGFGEWMDGNTSS